MPETDAIAKAIAERMAQILNTTRLIPALDPPEVGKRLSERDPPAQPYPPCTDVLLSLVPDPDPPDDLVREDFEDYFRFEVPPSVVLPDGIHGGLKRLVQDPKNKLSWPPSCCVCTPLAVLRGKRNLPPGDLGPPAERRHRRLHAGDIIWLFYYERMGIFKILGAVLDDYATRGKFPISNGSLEPGTADDSAALVVEIMIQQMKTGLASSVRDRDSSYRRVLGWTSDVGRQVGSSAQSNTGINTLFHKFLQQALEFYRDRRLARAIQGTAGSGTPPSVATLTSLGDTLRVLKQQLEAFNYGRNYFNVLNGIVWAIGGIAVLRALRSSLGIPAAFDSPHEYVPAAYELLVAGRAVTNADPNRYTVHRTCARSGRDLLLDIDGLLDGEVQNQSEGGPLDAWVTLVEPKVESYRTAYQTLTGLDLGQKAAPEQAA